MKKSNLHLYRAILLVVLFFLKQQHILAQCTPTTFSINQTPVVTGTPGAVNTTYRRTNIIPGVDVVFRIVSLNNGATLGVEDDPVGTAGVYLDAWQPTILPSTANTGGDGGITWDINFFVNGTSTPYRFNCLTVLAVDIDGDNSNHREYVEAVNPYSYQAQSAGTFLSYTSGINTLRSSASGVANVAGIDSTQKLAMVQYRFVNTTGIRYTTGYTRNSNLSTANRRFSLFFNTATNFPAAFTRFFNVDNDGLSSINETTDIDDDNDGMPDVSEYPAGYADPFGDADADGLPNYQDAAPGVIGNTFTDINADGVNDNYDIDLDGLVNSIDLDADGDGIPDLVEAGGTDTDGDGDVDAATDADADGLRDVYDSNSGGVNIANLDTDGDLVPNFRDLDSDNDGIPDTLEVGAIDANNDGKRDTPIDQDSDGLADAVDGDVGNDGVAENTAAALMLTGTDGNSDGRPDTYPRANADANGLPNPYDLDADGDGIVDTREAGIADSNNDGIADGTFGTDGWSDAVDALASLILTNTDGDARANYLDIDADNDGITDNVEAQSTAGYIAPAGSDNDGDGIDKHYDNDEITFGGFATNGLDPNNHDLADVPDYIDTDTDNDNNPDVREGNDWNGNGLPDENTTLTGSDTDGDGLDNVFDLVNGPDVTIVGFGGTGSRATAQQTIPAAANRDWRSILYSLPVTLISFSAADENGIVELNWVSEHENNFQHYQVERKTNAVTFSTISVVQPKAAARNSYQLTDDVRSLGTTVLYYRLKMVDKDGHYTYSGTVKVQANKVIAKSVAVKPNPVDAQVQLHIVSDVNALAKISIFSSAGIQVHQTSQAVTKGVNVLQLQSLRTKLAAGTYVVNVQLNGELLTTRFVAE